MKKIFLCVLIPVLSLFAGCVSFKGAASIGRTAGTNINAREAVARAANDMLDRSYQYGSLDCSGLAQKAYSKAGISIPRTSAAQYSKSVKVERSDIQKGDLVFFNTSGGGVSHVGVYMGGGIFIHAPKTGDLVRKDELENVYWKKIFIGAGNYF